MEVIKQNLLKIQDEIAPYTPNIIAVTKYFGYEMIVEAYNVGVRDFGESRVQQAVEKIQQLPKEVKENSRFHLIGHLQSNKVSQAVGNFDYIHSVDSFKLAQSISSESVKKRLKQKILLQLNNANEEQKFGFSKASLDKDFAQVLNLEGLEVVGLMNMAPLGADEDTLRRLFSDVVSFRDELEKRYDCRLKEISMGMSGDYKEAVVAGATMIRIGRKLFST